MRSLSDKDLWSSHPVHPTGSVLGYILALYHPCSSCTLLLCPTCRYPLWTSQLCAIAVATSASRCRGICWRSRWADRDCCPCTPQGHLDIVPFLYGIRSASDLILSLVSRSRSRSFCDLMASFRHCNPIIRRCFCSCICFGSGVELLLAFCPLVCQWVTWTCWDLSCLRWLLRGTSCWSHSFSLLFRWTSKVAVGLFDWFQVKYSHSQAFRSWILRCFSWACILCCRIFGLPFLCNNPESIRWLSCTIPGVHPAHGSANKL